MPHKAETLAVERGLIRGAALVMEHDLAIVARHLPVGARHNVVRRVARERPNVSPGQRIRGRPPHVPTP
jgi:hypothetical protein